jgi:acetyl/propionyl-CoA carboxylase alpha subunit/acetyl-CoA carboxylase carboxyltransferase component
MPVRPLTRLLIANRGEIAVRIVRAAAELGIASVAVCSTDDADALHVRLADEAWALGGTGPAAYLDAGRLVAAAAEAGCDAVHPGYGFLSEQAAFARLCEDAGLAFVGPQPDVLERFGDKAVARALAAGLGVPVLAGTEGPTPLDEAHAFVEAVLARGGSGDMLKAIAGGGGRGMRVVSSVSELAAAFERCRSEAMAAFGDGGLYVEELMRPARHVEVQVVGDGQGGVCHLGERECSIQRRNQKILELAPAPGLDPGVRDRLCDAALQMASAVSYRNVGTFEFLVDPVGSRIAFIEANARLQVEHTVTEEVTGVDLVRTQLLLAGGRDLESLGLTAPPATRGRALQLRINLETIQPDGSARPTGGVITAFTPPTGPGVRVDTSAYPGYVTNTRYDSLLAKLVVHTVDDDHAALTRKARRALAELEIEGVETNAGFLARVLSLPSFDAADLTTTFVDEHLASLVAEETAGAAPATEVGGRVTVAAPMQGTVISLLVAPGDAVPEGGPVAVMEAMKMEHVVAAPRAGLVGSVEVVEGQTVLEGHPLLWLEEADVDAGGTAADTDVDLDAVRPDLAEVHARHDVTLDAARPDAVQRRRASGQRTARENINDLCDRGSFVEYGPLMLAAQRRRRSLDELIAKTPADGLVAGIGRVNGELFGPERSQCAVMSYDYTVLAGTQGMNNHRKKDRLIEVAATNRLPMIVFAEGGGGRPGDTDVPGVAGFDLWTFHTFPKLSGLVPMVGVVSGRCFAGNAALLGCCDVVIAARDSNIGMGGPAMIEGGGLGVFHPTEIGPVSVQSPNGVIDVLVDDERSAVAVAKQYLSYFQGPVSGWSCADQRRLRSVIPENRLRVYDVRAVVEPLCDDGSVLELRSDFGVGMVTALVRIEGRPMGIIANNPVHLAGAIDSDGADKAARFMQLCDAFGLPILFLCDTPGIMVGPEVEKTALVRHASRMFLTGANLQVPFFTVVLRKGYGLGALTMAGGSFRAPAFTVSWPTGEFGGMGLEGAVRLGFRNELAAVEDPEQRRALYEEMVASMYERGKAVNMAAHFELDDVIDPVDTRRWILSGLDSAKPATAVPGHKRRPYIDSW